MNKFSIKVTHFVFNEIAQLTIARTTPYEKVLPNLTVNKLNYTLTTGYFSLQLQHQEGVGS